MVRSLGDRRRGVATLALPNDRLIRTANVEITMALTRKDWKSLGAIVLATQGPAYAARLRDRADRAVDSRERARLRSRADIVESAAASPKETVDAVEILHDLAFGKPRRRVNGKSKANPRRR